MTELNETFAFAQVRDYEDKFVSDVRKANKRDELAPTLGLALSGGGLRSATFQLGVLQALADADILQDVDYLSSVSGGGFLAGWFIKWIKCDGFHRVIDQLRNRTGQPTSPRIHWLRRYRNYLTPRLGLFKHDSFVFGTAYFHNALFNLVLFALAFAALQMLPRLWLGLLMDLSTDLGVLEILGGTLAFTSFLLMLFRLVGSIRRRTQRHPARYAFFLTFLSGIGLWVSPVCFRWCFAPVLLSALLWKDSDLVGALFHRRRKFRRSVRVLGGRLSQRVRAVSERWRLSATTTTSRGKRDASALLSIIVLMLFFVGVDRTGISPNWPLVLIVASCVSILLDSWLLSKGDRRLQQFMLVVPGFLGAFPITAYMYYRPERLHTIGFHHDDLSKFLERHFNRLSISIPIDVGLLVLIIVAFSTAARGVIRSRLRIASFISRRIIRQFTAALGTAAIAVSVLFHYPALIGGIPKLRIVFGEATPLHILTLLPPLCIVIGTLTFSFTVALLGHIIKHTKREQVWSTCATMYQVVVGWLLFSLVCIYVPGVVSTAPGFVRLMISAVWVVSIVTAFYQIGAELSGARRSAMDTAIATGSALVLLIGLLTVIAIWDNWMLKMKTTSTLASYMSQFMHTCIDPTTGVYAFMLLLISILLASRVGINLSSMHLFYQSRLARAYLLEELGPSTSSNPHTASGLRVGGCTYLEEYTPANGYCGPYPIFNAALNLGVVPDLAQQDRRAASFVFTPVVSGYDYDAVSHRITPDREATERTIGFSKHGYVRTKSINYEGESRMRLAAAMAISGSAIGPAMGYLTSVRTQILNTLFNLRLGWWLPNPSYPSARQMGLTGQRANMFFFEMLGRTNDDGPCVHLSDGGHFDNLGLYELVKRRCNTIIVSDASGDRAATLHELGRAIEKCRTDFNFVIDIKADCLVPKEERFSASCFVVGSIDYGSGARGRIIYLRPLLIKSLPVDLVALSRLDADFPNHSTLKQWFSESLFEGYRELGYRVTKTWADSESRQPKVA